MECTQLDSRIGVAVQAQEVNLWLGGASGIARLRGLQCTLAVQGKSRTEGILVGVEEDVCAIIFVVTESLAGILWVGVGGILSGTSVRLQC